MAKIINRFTGQIIAEDDSLTIKEIIIKNKANLRGTNLCDADLRGANLRDANLRGANLRGADLCGADLEQLKIWLNPCKRDILFILACFPIEEVEGLRQKIIAGKIDGTQYAGDCCCLIGSLGDDKAANCIPYYDKGIHNFGEQLFLQIKEGDTPETNQFSKIALELCDEFLNGNGSGN